MSSNVFWIMMFTEASQYKGGAFKIALVDRWIVVVSGPQLIEEIRKMPDEQMSFLDAASEVSFFGSMR